MRISFELYFLVWCIFFVITPHISVSENKWRDVFSVFFVCGMRVVVVRQSVMCVFIRPNVLINSVCHPISQHGYVYMTCLSQTLQNATNAHLYRKCDELLSVPEVGVKIQRYPRLSSKWPVL